MTTTGAAVVVRTRGLAVVVAGGCKRGGLGVMGCSGWTGAGGAGTAGGEQTVRM